MRGGRLCRGDWRCHCSSAPEQSRLCNHYSTASSAFPSQQMLTSCIIIISSNFSDHLREKLQFILLLQISKEIFIYSRELFWKIPNSEKLRALRFSEYEEVAPLIYKIWTDCLTVNILTIFSAYPKNPKETNFQFITVALISLFTFPSLLFCQSKKLEEAEKSEILCTLLQKKS